MLIFQIFNILLVNYKSVNFTFSSFLKAALNLAENPSCYKVKHSEITLILIKFYINENECYAYQNKV